MSPISDSLNTNSETISHYRYFQNQRRINELKIAMDHTRLKIQAMGEYPTAQESLTDIGCMNFYTKKVCAQLQLLAQQLEIAPLSLSVSYVNKCARATFVVVAACAVGMLYKNL